MDNKVRDAIRVLVEKLQTDEGYRIGWQANIAMAFQDEYYKFAGDGAGSVGFVNIEDVHEIANNSANNFLNLLCKDGSKERNN